MYLPTCFSKPHDGAHGVVLADVDGVLGCLLVVERRAAVAVEDLEVDEVDVHWVEPAAAVVLELPDLDVVEAGVGREQGEVAGDHICPGLSVDRPLLVLANEELLLHASSLRPHAPAGSSSPGRGS
jgi:hypothetical protein